MPAVNFKVRWPDGEESAGYSPSTAIYDQLQEGACYPLEDFVQRLETGLSAASERVKQVKGFYCSSAMDTLSALKARARRFKQGEVTVVAMQTSGAGRVLSGGWSSF